MLHTSKKKNMRNISKPDIRVTLSDLNIPHLNEETGMILNPNSVNSKTTTIEQSCTNHSSETANEVSKDIQVINTNQSIMENPTNFNTPQSSTTKSIKVHSITRKDKALFDLFKIHIENELRYTDSEFTLKVAARELGTNEKYLSSAINNCSGISFNALVNRYRIAHAKKLIYDDVLTRQNLEEIAYMSGYGNRTTFYRVFTELEGMTPSRFRDNYNKYFSI